LNFEIATGQLPCGKVEENGKLLKDMIVVIRVSNLDEDLTKNQIKTLYKFLFEPALQKINLTRFIL